MIMLAGENDISNLVSNITWSGDKDQIARKLAFSYLYTDQDTNIKSEDILLGTRIMMYDDTGTLKFDGVALALEKEESDIKIKLSCMDMAFYLKSEVYNTYQGSPAQITAAVCSEFGIVTGGLADNGKAVEVVSTGEKTIYQVIQTAYEDAGLDVHIYMNGLMLCVEEFGVQIAAVLTGDDAVINASYKSSIENMVDQVLILNDKGKYIKTLQNEEDIAAYGIIQKIYKKSDTKKDSEEEARKLIQSVENTGSISITTDNYECITGRKVIVMKAGSSICGLFNIVSDSHSISDGEHKVTLGLDFKGVQE